jgi:hypothetical protein
MISGLKFIVETPIPKAKRSGGFNTPQLATESVSKACFGLHTRDSSIGLNAPGSNTYCGCELQDRILLLF